MHGLCMLVLCYALAGALAQCVIVEEAVFASSFRVHWAG